MFTENIVLSSTAWVRFLLFQLNLAWEALRQSHCLAFSVSWLKNASDSRPPAQTESKDIYGVALTTASLLVTLTSRGHDYGYYHSCRSECTVNMYNLLLQSLSVQGPGPCKELWDQALMLWWKTEIFFSAIRIRVDGCWRVLVETWSQPLQYPTASDNGLHEETP